MEVLVSLIRIDEVKRHYPILDDYSPDMLAVKAYASERQNALASAASGRESQPRSDPEDEHYVWLRREDVENMTRESMRTTSVIACEETPTMMTRSTALARHLSGFFFRRECRS